MKLQGRQTYWAIAAANELEGTELVQVFGSNPDIDTGTAPETIWAEGGRYTFPTTAVQMSLVSTDANDTAAGTGATTVLLRGVDADFNDITEIVTMNGLTPVATTNSFLRINKMAVATSGTNNSNIGIITASNAGTVYSHMEAGISIAHDGFYSVPKGKMLVITQILLQLGKQAAGVGEVSMYRRSLNGDDTVNNTWFVENHVDLHSQAGPLFMDLSKTPIVLPEKNDFELVVPYTSVNNIEVTALFRCHLISNNKLI